MDALELLTADHNRVRGLFKLYRQACDGEETTRSQELVTKIIRELRVHTQLEERIFYPEVRPLSEKISGEVAEGLEEHHQAEDLLDQLESMEAGGEQWHAKVKVLIEDIEHHAGEEEEDLFPAVRTAASPDALQSWAQRMEAMKAELGAPTLADKIDLTTKELETLARAQEIPGRSKMKREELAATVAPPGT